MNQQISAYMKLTPEELELLKNACRLQYYAGDLNKFDNRTRDFVANLIDWLSKTPVSSNGKVCFVTIPAVYQDYVFCSLLNLVNARTNDDPALVETLFEKFHKQASTGRRPLFFNDSQTR